MIKQAFLASTFSADGELNRPSIMMDKLTKLASVINIINAIVEIGTGDIVREVLLEQTLNTHFCEVGKLVPSIADGFDSKTIFAEYVAIWMNNFLDKLSMEVRGVPGISYSHYKKQFVHWGSEGIVSCFRIITFN